MSWQGDLYNDVMEKRRAKGLVESLTLSGETRASGQSRREGSAQIIRQSRKQPNKTERRFETELLDLWKRQDDIAEYQFEAITLRLANGVRYTPDYVATGVNGATKIFEVKGGYVREDAKIKLKVAAAQFRHFEFYLAQYARGMWTINKVLP